MSRDRAIYIMSVQYNDSEIFNLLVALGAHPPIALKVQGMTGEKGLPTANLYLRKIPIGAASSCGGARRG